ncbi:MAG: sulfite exporter TauE/SafE family protein [Flavobacteriales bacterium]|nr:sulfite exporter TauE/SafE family protein [Flavobacteriales bacterium]
MEGADILFFVLAILCEIIGTVSGFGSSVFFVPIAGLFYPHHEVLFLTGLLHVFSNSIKIWLFRKHIAWNLVWKFGIPAVSFTILGAVLSKYVDALQANIFLGVFLILFSVMLLMWEHFSLKRDYLNIVLTGGISGFVAGIVGTGGAIRGLGLMAFNLEKELFVGTSAAIDMGVDFSRLWIYIANGFSIENAIFLVPMLIAASFLGTYIGKYLLGKISVTFFRRFVLLLILGIGIYLMILAFM